MTIRDSVRQASPGAIEAGFGRVLRAVESGAWLRPDNRYLANCIHVVDHEAENGVEYQHEQLTDYIAASSVLHCEDGWSFLGRALDCHSRGDVQRSIHFAYYAELRAAMSLLAAEGIGVFNRYHVFVDEDGVCHTLTNLPTHKAAWTILREWADTQRSGVVIGSVISPCGIALSSWLEAFGAANVLTAVGRDRFLEWGLDLKRLGEDQRQRNEASYRPGHLRGVEVAPVKNGLGFLRELWRACEPGASAFSAIDKHLLRISLKMAFRATCTDEEGVTSGLTAEAQVAAVGVQPSLARLSSDMVARYQARISATLGALDLRSPFREVFEEFLMGTAEPGVLSVITEASIAEESDMGRLHIPTICRALMLLRIATGSCAALLRRAGCTAEQLAFWWRPLGLGRGLWHGDEGPEQFVDLWEDVAAALTELGEWEQQQTMNCSLNSWRSDCGRIVGTLGECERVALWGLGL